MKHKCTDALATYVAVRTRIESFASPIIRKHTSASIEVVRLQKHTLENVSMAWMKIAQGNACVHGM